MDRSPKVTVITPTHNRSKLLVRAVESVLRQTMEDFEYIIVDDRCEDDTESVIAPYLEKDSRIKYIKQTKNNSAKTHCKPLNLGLKHAKGEYIAYLDDDNEWYAHHLEALLDGIKQGADVAYCDFVIATDTGIQKGIAMDFDAGFLLKRNFIDTSNILHKREVAFNIGGWDEEVTRFTDWNFCVRAMKWGHSFIRVPVVGTKYYPQENSQSRRTDVDSYYDPVYGMTMFTPTFDPAGCKIFCGYLGENKRETEPRVAIMTKTYERLDYTKIMWESLNESTDYPFSWFVFDQGSKDGTCDFFFDKGGLVDLSAPETFRHNRLDSEQEYYSRSGVYFRANETNVGITKADNFLLDMISDRNFDIIVHVDNDCQFMTYGWLESLVDLWKRNHLLYMSPYPEGLVHNPGGAPRVGYGNIGPYPIETTMHIGGFCAFIDAKAYKDFRWTDQFKHGNQDWEASEAFRKMGYMPCYIPIHRVWHIDTTAGQQVKYKDYFERRKKEKTEVA